MHAWIGFYSFDESSHERFAGDDDSVMLTGLKAISVSAILIPGTIFDDDQVGVCFLNHHIVCFV